MSDDIKDFDFNEILSHGFDGTFDFNDCTITRIPESIFIIDNFHELNDNEYGKNYKDRCVIRRLLWDENHPDFRKTDMYEYYSSYTDSDTKTLIEISPDSYTEFLEDVVEGVLDKGKCGIFSYKELTDDTKKLWKEFMEDYVDAGEYSSDGLCPKGLVIATMIRAIEYIYKLHDAARVDGVLINSLYKTSD